MNPICNIIANSHLKGMEVSCTPIKGIQDGDTIHIQQSQHYIYAIYRPSLQSTQPAIHINPQLMHLNHLQQGVCKVSRVSSISSRHVKVLVSQLDWQVINHQAIKLQEQFLNQVGIVWPNAQIPLYYTRNDYVTLLSQCTQVTTLQPYSNVEIITRPSQPTHTQIIRQLTYTPLNLSPNIGYSNTIIISQPLFNQMKLNQQQLYYVQNSSIIPYYVLNSIHNYKAYRKQNNHLQPIQITPSKLIQVKVQSSYKLKPYQYSCSEIGKQLCQLEDTIQLSNQPINIHTLSLTLMLKDKYLHVEVVTEQPIQPQYLRQQLSGMIINQIVKNNHIFILGNHLMVFQNKLMLLKMESGNNTKLIYPSNNIHNIQQLSIQLASKIKLKTTTIQGYPPQFIQMLNFIQNDRQNQQVVYKCFMDVYEKQIGQITQIINAQQSTNILITCNSNNGKTLMMKVLIQLGYNSWYIDLQNLNDSSHSIDEILDYIESFMQWCPYAIVYMDNLDNLCYKVDEGDVHRQQQKILSKVILRKILKFIKIYKKLVIFTAKSVDNIDPEFIHYTHFNLKNPTKQQMNAIITKYSSIINKEVNHSISFGSLVKYITTGVYVDKKIQNTFKYNFSKLAGLNKAKQFLRKTIQKPLKYGSLYKKLPIKMPRGVLLYGPTGTGKTALGNSLKDQFGVKYFSIKGSDILSKYIGGSEAAVRQIFQKAMSVSPSIIFFDEFQSIAPKRNAASTGVNDRVVNQLLCYLDGVSSTEGVFIVAASSRPDMIDPALLRPGRLDIHLFLDYPDQNQRLQLLSLYSKSVKINIEQKDYLKITQNYNYSDLVGLFKQLRIKKSSLLLKSQNYEPNQFKEISKQFFIQTVQSFKISVSHQQQQKQKKIYKKFRSKEGPQMKQQKTILM